MKTPAEPGLVSIVTPVYNAAPYLPETIRSVQGQTYPRWEWLLVNDGSTDDSERIIRSTASEDSRIIVLRTEGSVGSAARARNTAKQNAHGEYLAYLDADDLWDPTKTEKQIDYLLRNPHVDGITCGYDLFGDRDQLSRDMRVMKTSRIVSRKEIPYGSPFPTPTLLFRKSCFDQIGGMDDDPRLVPGEDYEYFARLIARYEFHRLPETLVHVRVSPPGGSLSARHLSGESLKGIGVLEVLQEKKILAPAEASRMKSFIFYTQAADNLFRHDAPFRRLLLKSILAGRPSVRAVIMCCVCLLPSPVLKRVLIGMQSVRRHAAGG